MMTEQGPQHYSTAEGWFYIMDDVEVGPFDSEWAMYKYMEDREILTHENRRRIPQTERE